VRTAALAAAVLAALTWPSGRHGIAVPLVAVLVGACVRAATSRRRDLVVYGAPALALASMAAVRDSGWVVALDLAAAVALACATAAGPAVAALLAPLRLRAAPTLLPEPPAAVGAVARGSTIAVCVSLPFVLLFASADAAFSEIVDVPLPAPESLTLRLLVLCLVLAGALGLGLAARRPRAAVADPARRRLARWEWLLPLALLDAVFALFVAVQLAVLFGGRDHVLETSGLTYAEYARQGFWQLLAAASLTLVVVGVAARYAGPVTRADRRVLRALLAVLCALTGVVLASALHRLGLYEDAFGLTRARLAAQAALVWLGGVFALVLLAGAISGVRSGAREAAVIGTALALLGFSLANPDGIVASRNVDRWDEEGRIDLRYLQGLSADAVPAILELDHPARDDVLRPLRAELAGDDPWSSANLSRHRARSLLGTG
jgi:hypothetical protein